MNLKCFFRGHDWIVSQPTKVSIKFRDCQRCGRRDHWFEIPGIRGHWFNVNSEISKGIALAGLSFALAALVITLVILNKKEKPCSTPTQSMPTSSTQPVRCETP